MSQMDRFTAIETELRRRGVLGSPADSPDQVSGGGQMDRFTAIETELRRRGAIQNVAPTRAYAPALTPFRPPTDQPPTALTDYTTYNRSWDERVQAPSDGGFLPRQGVAQQVTLAPSEPQLTEQEAIANVLTRLKQPDPTGLTTDQFANKPWGQQLQEATAIVNSGRPVANEMAQPSPELQAQEAAARVLGEREGTHIYQSPEERQQDLEVLAYQAAVDRSGRSGARAESLERYGMGGRPMAFGMAAGDTASFGLSNIVRTGGGTGEFTGLSSDVQQQYPASSTAGALAGGFVPIAGIAGGASKMAADAALRAGISKGGQQIASVAGGFLAGNAASAPTAAMQTIGEGGTAGQAAGAVGMALAQYPMIAHKLATKGFSSLDANDAIAIGMLLPDLFGIKGGLNVIKKTYQARGLDAAKALAQDLKVAAKQTELPGNFERAPITTEAQPNVPRGTPGELNLGPDFTGLDPVQGTGFNADVQYREPRGLLRTNEQGMAPKDANAWAKTEADRAEAEMGKMTEAERASINGAPKPVHPMAAKGRERLLQMTPEQRETTRRQAQAKGPEAQFLIDEIDKIAQERFTETGGRATQADKQRYEADYKNRRFTPDSLVHTTSLEALDSIAKEGIQAGSAENATGIDTGVFANPVSKTGEVQGAYYGRDKIPVYLELSPKVQRAMGRGGDLEVNSDGKGYVHPDDIAKVYVGTDRNPYTLREAAARVKELKAQGREAAKGKPGPKPRGLDADQGAKTIAGLLKKGETVDRARAMKLIGAQNPKRAQEALNKARELLAQETQPPLPMGEADSVASAGKEPARAPETKRSRVEPWDMSRSEFLDWSRTDDFKKSRKQAEEAEAAAEKRVLELEGRVGARSRSSLGKAGSAQGMSPKSFGLLAAADEARSKKAFDSKMEKMPPAFKAEYEKATADYERAHARVRSFEDLETAKEQKAILSAPEQPSGRSLIDEDVMYGESSTGLEAADVRKGAAPEPAGGPELFMPPDWGVIESPDGMHFRRDGADDVALTPEEQKAWKRAEIKRRIGDKAGAKADRDAVLHGLIDRLGLRGKSEAFADRIRELRKNDAAKSPEPSGDAPAPSKPSPEPAAPAKKPDIRQQAEALRDPNTGKVSRSMLQRKLNLGYAKAKALADELNTQPAGDKSADTPPTKEPTNGQGQKEGQGRQGLLSQETDETRSGGGELEPTPPAGARPSAEMQGMLTQAQRRQQAERNVKVDGLAQVLGSTPKGKLPDVLEHYGEETTKALLERQRHAPAGPNPDVVSAAARFYPDLIGLAEDIAGQHKNSLLASEMARVRSDWESLGWSDGKTSKAKAPLDQARDLFGPDEKVVPLTIKKELGVPLKEAMDLADQLKAERKAAERKARGEVKGDKPLPRGDEVWSPVRGEEARDDDGVAPSPDEVAAPYRAKKAMQAKANAVATSEITGPQELIDALYKGSRLAPPGLGKSQSLKTRALGWIRIKPEAIRQRRADDAPTAVHEFGHFLHKLVFQGRKAAPLTRRNKSGLDQNLFPAAWQPELMHLGRQLYGNQKPAGGYASEGWAELVRLMLTDPLQARASAPRAYKDAVAKLQRDFPEVWSDMEAFRKGYEAFVMSDPVKKLATYVRAKTKDTDQPSWVDRMAIKLFDHMRPMEMLKRDLGLKDLDPTDDPHLMALRAQGRSTGDFRVALQYGRFNKAGQMIGDGLAKILTPVRKSMEEFNVYLAARRAIEKRGQGYDGIFKELSTKDLHDAIADLDKAYPEFAKAAADFQEFNQWLIRDYAVGHGLITAKQAEMIIAKNLEYATFAAVDFLEGPGVASTFGVAPRFTETGTGIRRFPKDMMGKMIEPPIEAFMASMEGIMARAQRNNTAKALVRHVNAEQAGRWFREIDTPKDLTLLKGEDVRKIMEERLKKQGITTGMDPIVDAMLALTEMDDFKKFTAGTRVSTKTREFSVLINGKMKFYEASGGWQGKMLHDFLQGKFAPDQAGTVFNALKIPRTILRATATTLNPDFFVYNFPRDLMQAALMSTVKMDPGGAKHVLTAKWKGMARALSTGDAGAMYKLSGAEQSSLFQEYVDKGTKRWKTDEIFDKPNPKIFPLREVKEGQIKKAVIDMLKLGPIERLNNRFELASRLMEFEGRLAQADLKKGGRTMEDVYAAGQAAADITLDFSRGGKWTKEINQGIPFFNAAFLGGNKLWRYMRDNPVEFASRMGTYIILPSIVQHIMNRNNPDYWNIDQRQRDRYWHLPLGDVYGDGVQRWIKLPKPYGVGIFAVLAERGLAAIDGINPVTGARGDSDAARFGSVVGAAIDQFRPPLNVPLITPIFELIANYSIYQDREIVSPGEQAGPPGERGAERSSEFAATLGGLADIPPPYVDYVISNTTAGTGTSINKYIVDPLLRKGKDIAGVEPRPRSQIAKSGDYPIVRRLIAEEARTNSEVLNRFWNQWNDLENIERGLTKRKGDKRGEYREENSAEIRAYRRMKPYKDQVSDQFKKLKQVYNTPDLTPEERQKRERDIIDKIHESARKGLINATSTKD